MSGTENENGKFGAGFKFRKQVNRTKWESCKKAIYDPTTKEFLGRNKSSWGKLLLFYGIFYVVLAVLFAICLQGLFATLSDKHPKWLLGRSLIGINPGLGFRPISNKTEEGSLIWYNIKNKTSVERWTALIDEFLEPYMANQTGKNFVPCDFNKPPENEKVCKTDTSLFGECSKGNSTHYGYDRGSPCIFLKLNKIFNWEPKFFKTPQPYMPFDINTTINGLPDMRKSQVWVSCNGENAYDRENVKLFTYNPPGFPGYFYPYTNNANYLSPLVAVQIRNPERNVIINIECRAWAENINYIGGSLKREGSVHFELLIDDPDEEMKPSNPSAARSTSSGTTTTTTSTSTTSAV